MFALLFLFLTFQRFSLEKTDVLAHFLLPSIVLMQKTPFKDGPFSFSVSWPCPSTVPTSNTRPQATKLSPYQYINGCWRLCSEYCFKNSCFFSLKYNDLISSVPFLPPNLPMYPVPLELCEFLALCLQVMSYQALPSKTSDYTDLLCGLRIRNANTHLKPAIQTQFKNIMCTGVWPYIYVC